MHFQTVLRNKNPIAKGGIGPGHVSAGKDYLVKVAEIGNLGAADWADYFTKNRLALVAEQYLQIRACLGELDLRRFGRSVQCRR